MASASRSHENLRPGECGVCLSLYDEKECRPRTLPCGHTYCSTCLHRLIKGDHLTCPNCCANHWAPSIKQFPVCYALEDMIRAMKASHFGTHSQDKVKDTEGKNTDNEQKVTVGLSKKMQAMVEEQKVNMKSLEAKLEEELDQLNQYRAQLTYSLSEHGHMIEELDRYVQQHQATINLLQEEDVKTEAVVEEGKEVQRELKDAQCQLDQVTTASEAINTTVSIDSNIARVELWLQHSQKEIPNGATLSTSYKVLETTKVTLELVSEDTEAPPVEIFSGHMNCTIMEAAKNAEGRHIKLVDLSVKEVRKKIDAGQVFAVLRNENGHWYSSKVTYNENKLYLHSLQQLSLPKGVSTVEVSKTVQDLDCFSPTMFMDLSWNNNQTAHCINVPGSGIYNQPAHWTEKSKKRFHIRLETGNQLVKKFMTLVLGHTGVSLIKTIMSRVENNGNSWHTLTLWGSIPCQGITHIPDQGIAHTHNIHQHWGIFTNLGREQFTPIRGMLVVRTNQANAAQIMDIGIVIANQNQSQAHSYGQHQTNGTISCLGYVDTAELESLESVLLLNHPYGHHRTIAVNVDDCGVVLPQ